MPSPYIVGVDPGKHTGLVAVQDGKLVRAATVGAHQAWAMCLMWAADPGISLIVLEDARLRGGSKAAAQGAGSVKRDCTLWLEWAAMHAVPIRSVRPDPRATKWPADRFARLTGWTGRTSSHARDAALLVWGLR